MIGIDMHVVVTWTHPFGCSAGSLAVTRSRLDKDVSIGRGYLNLLSQKPISAAVNRRWEFTFSDSPTILGRPPCPIHLTKTRCSSAMTRCWTPSNSHSVPMIEELLFSSSSSSPFLLRLKYTKTPCQDNCSSALGQRSLPTR